MKAQAVEEHLFAEDVHFFNCDEQGRHTCPNDRAGQGSNRWISQLGLHPVIIINYLFFFFSIHLHNNVKVILV